MHVSTWNKFRLIMWKNWLIQWHRKHELLYQIFIPVLFVLLLVVPRKLVDPKEPLPIVIFNPQNISSIPIELYEFKIKFELAYSPQNQYLEKIMTLAAKKLNLSAIALANAARLEEYLIQNDVLAGVKFNDKSANLKKYPEKFSFSLRFPREPRRRRNCSWNTNILYPAVKIPGNPREAEHHDGGTPGYIDEGFIAIQHAIFSAFVECVDIKQTKLPDVFLQRYPYPSVQGDRLLNILSLTFPLIIVLSFIYPYSCFVKYVVSEKESQIKEVLILIGIGNWIHWAAWFLKSLILMSISLLFIVILLKVRWNTDYKVGILTETDYSVLIVFLLLYAASSICFCFMISSFFSRAAVASFVTGIIWFLTYLPSNVSNYAKLTLNQKLALSIFSNTAMHYGLSIITKYEQFGGGLKWNQIFETINEDEDLHLGHVIIMMSVSGAIYFVIALYIEKVFPGFYGVPQPYYFPCLQTYWCPGATFHRENMRGSLKRKLEDGFEAEPIGKIIGVQIRAMQKKYDEKIVLQEMNMNLYEGEITVLLGHNGAGKTTIVSLLTGMFPPTDGTAIVNGYDILTDLQDARESVGFCPAHNILFDDLTVKEHIIFFSLLKGTPQEGLEAEIDKYVNLLGLSDKIDTPAQKLSGGMKRKLCVVLALCGKTKVIFLDEPSIGMNPADRRALWELLQKQKAGRTILLLTHFMDETEVLADRIAILSNGQLMCYGTSFFLKQRYGAGYYLTIEKGDGCDVHLVTALLRKYISDIHIDRNVGTELSYKIPEEYANIIERMLAALEENTNELMIMSYSISVTNLEEVFLAVEQEAEQNRRRISRSHTNPSLTALRNYQMENTEMVKGCGLLINQCKAMFLKKYYQLIRSLLAFFIHIFVSIVITALTFADRESHHWALPPLLISLKSYENPVAVLEANETILANSLNLNISHQYAAMFNEMLPGKHLEHISEDFQEYILDLAKKDFVRVERKYLAGATFSKDSITGWFNNELYHTPPLTLNLIHNAIARTILGENYCINIINEPLHKRETPLKPEIHTPTEISAFEVATNISFCMAFTAAYYVRFLISERVSRAKLLQFISGAKIWAFWLSGFIMDYISFLVMNQGILLVMFLYQGTIWSGASVLFAIIFLVFGIAALPLTYFFSFWFNSPASGYTGIVIINIFTGLASFATCFIVQLIKPKIADHLRWLFMLSPHFSLADALYRVSYVVSSQEACNKRCQNLPVCNMSILCKYDIKCCPTEYFQWTNPGCGANLIYMITTGIVFFTIILIIDYGWIHNIIIWSKEVFLPKRKYPKIDVEDDDVAAEKERIRSMTKDEISKYDLVIDRLTKYYGNNLVINQISAKVAQSECFGLVGTSSAGKTVTFRILIGDETISLGNAYVRGVSIKTNKKSLYQKIGYCPQSISLIDDLTCRETFNFFALMRGVPPNRIRAITKDIANALGFSKQLDKYIRCLSRGNKRKMCAAVAVIGLPNVIFLDSPTSGMDPGARRKLWNMLIKIKAVGKSIVFTTHSMEECEVLCSRLAIMVNGEFKCMGTTQHLKDKFTKGFVIKMKLKKTEIPRSVPIWSPKRSPKTSEIPGSGLSTQDSNETVAVGINRTNNDKSNATVLNAVEKVKEFIESKFPEAILKEQYLDILVFYIPTTTMRWSAIFGLIESNRSELNIQSYSISHTTIEEIFLEFALQQRDSVNTCV